MYSDNLRNSLIFFADFGIDSLIDVPCGDFNWVKELDLTAINYVGLDSSSHIIKELRSKHPSHIWIQFDVLSDQLPFSKFVLMRDLLVHLSNEEIESALANVIRSGSIYLAVTNFSGVNFNLDFTRHHYRKRVYWRPINLQLEPFNFPPPVIRIFEEFKGNAQYQDKCLDIYRIKDLSLHKFNSEYDPASPELN